VDKHIGILQFSASSVRSLNLIASLNYAERFHRVLYGRNRYAKAEWICLMISILVIAANLNIVFGRSVECNFFKINNGCMCIRI
jgi:hypothetical protein